MIKFHKKPGVLIEAVPAHPGSFMVKRGEKRISITVDFSFDRESEAAVHHYIKAYRALFDEVCIGPDGHRMVLGELKVNVPPRLNTMDADYEENSWHDKPSRWARLLNWWSKRS